MSSSSFFIFFDLSPHTFGLSLHSLSLKLGLSSEPGYHLITISSKPSISLLLFNQIQIPNVVSWTALISSSFATNTPRALRRFLSMLRHPTLPNQRTLQEPFFPPPPPTSYQSQNHYQTEPQPSMHFNPLQTHNQTPNNTTHTNKSSINTTHTSFLHTCLAFCRSHECNPVFYCAGIAKSLTSSHTSTCFSAVASLHTSPENLFFFFKPPLLPNNGVTTIILFPFPLPDSSSSSILRLQLLYSKSRIVLLCHKCLARVESAELCSYCFTSSSSGGDCFSCRNCKRRVHRDCDSNYRSAAVRSGSSSGEEISFCGDCWVSESLVRWKRNRNNKGCVRSKATAKSELGFERSRVSDPSQNRKCGAYRSLDSCSEEGGGCSVRLDDVVDEEVEEEEENVDVVEDEDEPFKEGQGSCLNGGEMELEACSSPPEDYNCMTRLQFETCNGSILDPYYFKYTRRKRSGVTPQNSEQ